tara:strand:- start:22653 stop:22814 length:162 start_codon:yes stop_codon:yes gene_type:complete
MVEARWEYKKIGMKDNKECWQLLVEALEIAPSQEVKDAIANVIALRIKELQYN